MLPTILDGTPRRRKDGPAHADCRRAAPRRARFERLEDRRMLSAIASYGQLTGVVADPLPAVYGSATPSSTTQPTIYEQYLLELINRGRADPPAEAARYGIDLNEGLDPGTISTEPKQPLAFSPELIAAARGHSDWMLANDTFSHTGEGGSTPGDRMAAAGYSFDAPWGWAENIAWNGTTGTFDTAEYTAEIHAGLYGSAGHRANQMNDAFREIGTGLAEGPFFQDGTTWNALIATENFAYSGTSLFLTGVVYDDALALADQFYTPGEGLGAVTIEATRDADAQLFTTQTWASGGYSLALPAGTYSVVATGGPLGAPLVQNNVVVDTQNVKVDFSPPENTTPGMTSLVADPNPVVRPGSTTLTAEGVSDPDGTVARVEFYHGATLLGEDTSGGDGWTWTVSTAGWTLGEHTLSARAQDDDGAWSEPVETTLEVIAPADAIGIHRSNTFYLDYNGSGAWDGTGVDRMFRFGSNTDTPITGDWNGDGTDSIGVHRDNTFYLDYNGNGQWDGTGVDRMFRFGSTTDTPIIGDWNGDGKDAIGVHRDNTFYLDYNGNGAWDGTGVDRMFRFGSNTDTPITGDWNGDGTDSIGVHRDNTFYLDYNGNGAWDGTGVDRMFRFGSTTDTPITGDWNGDGTDSIGVHRANDFYLDYNGNGAWDGTGVDRMFRFGSSTDTPIIGAWSGGQALHAAGFSPETATAGPVLDDEAVTPVVFAAIADWTTLLDLGAEQVAALHQVEFVMADLPGTMLGWTQANTIDIDPNAAGFGWYIDPTPALDEEFEPLGSTGRLRALDASLSERMDLLTVISHELGHVLGLADLDPAAESLMGSTLQPGQRHRPGAAERDAYFAAIG